MLRVASMNGQSYVRSRALILSTLIGLSALVFTAAAATAQSSPNASVFQVLVWRPDGRRLQTMWGTGFFIRPDGTALTASHVVYPVRHNRTFQLAAIIGKEVYGAVLVCASELAADPATNPDVAPSRDVAEIRVTASSANSLPDLTFNGAPFVSAHRGPLPEFPFLRLAAPQEGDDVRTFGFGRRPTAPIPYPWSASGTVERIITFHDGTPGFQVRYANPAEPGHSGSPVLNARSEVIGMHNWHSRQDPHLGIAVGSAALDPACP